ncbi:MAG: hypothetical protein ACREC9_01125 [Methylocella sp.]
MAARPPPQDEDGAAPDDSMTPTPAHLAGAKLWRMIETTRKNISVAARRTRSNLMTHKLLREIIARPGRFIFSLKALA